MFASHRNIFELIFLSSKHSIILTFARTKEISCFTSTFGKCLRHKPKIIFT